MIPVDQEEYHRWIGQARYTFTSAQRDARATDFSWACFKAQQAAEYGIKALFRGLGQPATGHSLIKLAESLERSLEVSVPEHVWDAARLLDRHYIPPRYPDAFPSGMPHEFYDRSAAAAALDAARQVLAFVQEVAGALGLEGLPAPPTRPRRPRSGGHGERPGDHGPSSSGTAED